MQIAKIGSFYTYKYNNFNRAIKNNAQNPIETRVNPEVNDLNYYQNYSNGYLIFHLLDFVLQDLNNPAF